MIISGAKEPRKDFVVCEASMQSLAKSYLQFKVAKNLTCSILAMFHTTQAGVDT
jgi:hypothetical protein